jgi:hypothetical protein
VAKITETAVGKTAAIWCFEKEKVRCKAHQNKFFSRLNASRLAKV